MMEEVVRFVGRALFQLFVEWLGYCTGRVLVPLLTLGRITVGDEAPRRSRALTYRLPDGTRVMHSDCAAGLGVMFWLALFVGFVVLRYFTSA